MPFKALSPNPKPRIIFSVCLLLPMAVCVYVAAELLVWFSLYQRFYLKMLVLATAGAVVFLVGWNAESRPIRRIGLWAIIAAMFASAVLKSWMWWTDERFVMARQEIPAWRYRPFSASNQLIRVEAPPEFRLQPPLGIWIKGRPMFYPIYAAAMQALCSAEVYNGNIEVFERTNLFKEFSYNPGLLLFSTEPFEKQHDDRYEMTPFASEALVFFVNPQNPIDNLSLDAIRGIYTGVITEWPQLGIPVIPFQRGSNNGAQVMFQKIIGNPSILPPVCENTLSGGMIREDVAEYHNYPGAIGFSFRYYVKDEPRIKLLSIDGIAPTPENIANGIYPLMATCYMITQDPRNENTRKFVDFMLSPQGREIIEKTGYTPL